jgi:hypothetical protein
MSNLLDLPGNQASQVSDIPWGIKSNIVGYTPGLQELSRHQSLPAPITSNSGVTARYMAGVGLAVARAALARQITANRTNLYLYAFNNPVMYVDPDGNFPVFIGIGKSGPTHTAPSPPTMTCVYGPPGEMGHIVCEINGKQVLSCQADNITTNNDASPTETGADGPIPVGVFHPGPPWHLGDGRPGVHCNVPNRPGVCIHSSAPGKSFGWYPTQGCIRVTPTCIDQLIPLMKQYKTTLGTVPFDPTVDPLSGYQI